ncbi:hypothetical protein [Clostridium amazonitimonense]|uniref:hypothetical protein n=1 Tax=Clostridium amazonitimonense TaxID=1499689 RepID=UPI00068A237A|nr:hypothetical protein [Clostridium amazonitimonense]
MVIENDCIKITIKEDRTYTINSVDNKQYDSIFNPFKYTRNDFVKTMEVVIQNKFTEEIRIGIIGSIYGDDSQCAVLKDKELLILIDRDIYVIDIDEYRLVKYQNIECTGTNFAIYLIDNGYIIYGELEIVQMVFT